MQQKNQTGQYQTGEDVLLKLAAKKDHKIADDILVSGAYKIKINPMTLMPYRYSSIKTGRVHTTYGGQAVAVTGRLASNNPNFKTYR